MKTITFLLLLLLITGCAAQGSNSSAPDTTSSPSFYSLVMGAFESLNDSCPTSFSIEIQEFVSLDDPNRGLDRTSLGSLDSGDELEYILEDGVYDVWFEASKACPSQAVETSSRHTQITINGSDRFYPLYY